MEQKDYISSFKGIDVSNLELLAEIIYRTGIRSPKGEKERCLQKALQIYELCNEMGRTFSFDRKSKMNDIRSVL